MLLDVAITDEAEELDVERSLNDLLSTANHWRSLCIYCCSYGLYLCATNWKLSKFEFPSPVEIFTTMNRDSEYADSQILLPRAPTLHHLRLKNFIASDDFSTASALKTPELIIDDPINIPRSSLLRIPTALLVRLILIGNTNNRVLKPSSTRFPG